MSEPKLELYAAMAKAFDALTYLQKAGTGAHAAISHDAVKRAVSREFQRCGLIWFPSEVRVEMKENVNKDNEKNGYMTTATVAFTTVHIATGQEITQVFSGQGYDPLDSGLAKAWSRAIKGWGIATFMIESGSEAEVDDNDQPIDKDSIERSFKRIKQDLHKVAPSREKADAKFAEIIGYYKTHSKRLVEDPREFKTRAEARQAYAALIQVKDIWGGERFEAEAEGEAAKQKPKPAAKRAPKPEPLTITITDDDLPPELRGQHDEEPSDVKLDAAMEQQESASSRLKW